MQPAAARCLRLSRQQSYELSASVSKPVMRTNQSKEFARKNDLLVSYSTLASTKAD